MSHEDYTVESLAAYLHVLPAQIEKLAQRGNLPGRKIGGQWRFSSAEVHHWMEDRMGLLDEEELVQVEGALERAAGAGDETHGVADQLPVEAIAIPLQARTRNRAINEMCQLAAGTGLLWDPEAMAEAVRAREDLYPTALENGVALLHPRRPLSSILAEPFLALGITGSGIPFAGSGILTDIFFLICSTDDRTHLYTLARLSRLINDHNFLTALRAAPDAAAAHALVAERERGLVE